MKIKAIGIAIGTLLLGGVLFYSIQMNGDKVDQLPTNSEATQLEQVDTIEMTTTRVTIPNYVSSLFTDMVLTVGDTVFEITETQLNGGEPVQLPVNTPGVLSYNTPWEEGQIDIAQFDKSTVIDLPVMTEEVVVGLKEAIASEAEETAYMLANQTFSHLETIGGDVLNEFSEELERRFTYTELLEAYKINSVKAAFKDYYEHWYIENDRVVVYVTKSYDHATYLPTEKPVFETRTDTSALGFTYDSQEGRWINEYSGIGYGHVIQGAEDIPVNTETYFPNAELVASKTEQYLDPSYENYDNPVDAFYYQEGVSIDSYHYSLLIGLERYLRGEEDLEESSVPLYLTSDSPVLPKFKEMRESLLSQKTIVDLIDSQVIDVQHVEENTVKIISKDEVVLETADGDEERIYLTTMVFKYDEELLEWRLHDFVESVEY